MHLLICRRPGGAVGAITRWGLKLGNWCGDDPMGMVEVVGMVIGMLMLKVGGFWSMTSGSLTYPGGEVSDGESSE